MAAPKRPSRSGNAPGRITDILPTGEMVERPSGGSIDFGSMSSGSSPFRFPLSQAEHRDRQERGLDPAPSTASDAPAETAKPKRNRPRAKTAKTSAAPSNRPTVQNVRIRATTNSSSRSSPPPPVTPTMPATVGQARSIAHSDGAKALIDLAAAIAAETKPDQTRLGARDLLWALLAEGQRQSKVETASRWLHDWIAERSTVPIASVIAPYIDIKRAPVHGFMPLTAHASAVLARASSIATLTVKRAGYDIRHIAVALTLADAASANENVLGMAQREFDVDLRGFPSHLLDIIATSHERAENMEAWQSLVASPLPSPSRQTVPEQRPRTDTVVNFNPDRVSSGGADPLGIQADVSAFARLICLEEATPPLSIGLFGEWGSGKSSFMERLQGEIASLTRKEREARRNAAEAAKTAPASAPAAAQPPAPRFVENVVQIRFNAWHYADANLWASLTAEFFDQLRRGGHAGQRSSDYLALIGKVADRVRSLETTAKQADGALVAAATAAKQADKALAEAREKLAASDLAVASEHLGAELKTFQKENAASLKEVGTRVYRTDLSKDIDGLTAAVSEASSIPGKIALVSRVIASGGAATWLAAAAVVLVAAAGLGWRAGDPASLAVLVQRMIAWGSGALAALGALWQATASVRPVLDGAWRYAKAVEAARKRLAEQVAAREKEASDAKGKLAEAEKAAQEAKAPLAQYGAGATAGSPGTILRYFLFEDGDVRDYDKQVGLVSRARRSFEQLDAIFSAARDGRAAKEKQARGEALNEAETKALKRYEAMALDEQGVKIPDRIVLYIDDLDRCTHAQVFDVLQAIHLLLAFELFVVVVGVDVRWVEEAVARQFTPSAIDLPDNATTTERETTQKRRETEQRKRAIDYLEKIFQLPFWLRRLTTDGGQGGSYGAYVKDLLKANLDVAETTPSPLAPLKATAKTGFAAPAGPAAVSAEASDNLIAPDDEAVAEAEELASIDLALATVRLTQAEVDFLASPELGAIAFKSPRAVKRMLNIYRIVRARMGEAELDDFLGRAGKPPTWPIAAFMAAVETGQPVEVADALYHGISTEEPWQFFDIEHMSTLLDDHVGERSTTSGFAALAEAEKLANGALSLAVAAMDVSRGGTDEDAKTPTIADMLAMARIVRRYSFNRYN
jgi:hypothetical protein